MSEIAIEHNPSPAKLDVLYVEEWPIRTQDVSTFDWTYNEKEMCYVLKGKATVTTESGETVMIGLRDLVTFPQGLTCTWAVTQTMREHYILGRHF